MTSLHGRIAVVTGASRGIGLSIAEALLERGANVALCARDSVELEKTGASLAARFGPGRAYWQRCDVASFGDAAAFRAGVVASLGSPSVLVNNAGVVVRRALADMTEADWDLCVDANLKGVFNVTHAFLPDLRVAGGRVVNIASISGRLGTPRLSAYCAAKHGVIGFTRALAEELRPDGVQVNAVAPGSVDTQMLAGSGFDPAMGPGDVAGVVLYLVADAPPALTGACLDVFG